MPGEHEADTHISDLRPGDDTEVVEHEERMRVQLVDPSEEMLAVVGVVELLLEPLPVLQLVHDVPVISPEWKVISGQELDGAELQFKTSGLIMLIVKENCVCLSTTAMCVCVCVCVCARLYGSGTIGRN